jgi:ABC-type branched-subunit amino acid transport system substrate-binding protein
VTPTGKVMRVSLMMPLHLDKIDEISTTKFDIEQRGKKSYKQFEFIEFYEGVRMALDEVTSKLGIDVELNVVDVSENTDAAVERAFRTHNIAQSDFVVALLLRDAFNKVSDLAREAGVYVVNPMATRSDITANNPYMVKIQPSMESQVRAMLDNMKLERPNSQLYIIHSGAASEKALLNEVKRQLTERGEIRYILFNWSQNAKLGMAMKKTPNCNVLSIYDNKQDQMRIYVSTLLNRLAAFKTDAPTLYTISDWTREYPDVDLSQLQQLNYHTFSTAWDMTNNIHVEFLKTFRDTYGTEPNSQLAATAYDLITYIVNGLHEKNVGFWQEPTQPSPEMLFPLHLSRNKAGLENDSPQLFRMEMLRFVPVRKY